MFDGKIYFYFFVALVLIVFVTTYYSSSIIGTTASVSSFMKSSSNSIVIDSLKVKLNTLKSEIKILKDSLVTINRNDQLIIRTLKCRKDEIDLLDEKVKLLWGK